MKTKTWIEALLQPGLSGALFLFGRIGKAVAPKRKKRERRTEKAALIKQKSLQLADFIF
ncbi:hypothetical protein [Epilithonimonas lactis]|uniref:hypothetical protein n=1 Tax=Epilithonimonas lactis TaxID=421072 RepID=UPI0013F444B1|nr:hypothetical protein [Epilithonimonas lactis]